jgi:hypothetical protein
MPRPPRFTSRRRRTDGIFKMLALYLLSLATSAGLVGLFIRQVLGTLGYVQQFRLEVILAGGAASGYLASQLAYMAAVRLLKPTRSPGPLFAEIFSHLAAIALIPYLLRIHVPWSHPVLAKVEPLVYFGVFAGLHALFKLASFYAAIRGAPAGRLAAMVWLAAAGACTVAAGLLLQTWLAQSEQARPRAPETTAYYRVGDAYAAARDLPEGALLTCGVSPHPGQCLTLRWANAAGANVSPVAKQKSGRDNSATHAPASNAPSAPSPDETEPLERVYITVTLQGAESYQHTWSVDLEESAWTELRVPSEYIPDNVTKCHVVWDAEKAPPWQKFIRLRPTVTSRRKLLCSGPWSHEQPSESSGPSFIILTIEGLGAAHISCLGYKRDTTPGLDRFARGALLFQSAYTPAPEAAAACMTLLTGVSPLRHGFFGTQRGPLPTEYQTLAEVLSRKHYATAAFTEGEGTDEKDLIFGGGFERGFELFDPSSPPRQAGAAATIDKVQAWVDKHADRKCFVFVRLRELRDPQWSERYAPGFVADPATPAALDVYDSAVASLDRRLGDFLKHLRSTDAGKHACIIVTAPYGLDFSSGESALPTVGLTENSVHVPLVLYAPDLTKMNRAGPVGLEDVAPAVLAMAGTGVDYRTDGKDLVQDMQDRFPVSMLGNPLALSIRVDRWRYVWQSGRSPRTLAPGASEGPIELYDIFQARKTGYRRNVMALNPDLVRRYTVRLQDFLGDQIISRTPAKTPIPSPAR